jgi:hypothetical protein
MDASEGTEIKEEGTVPDCESLFGSDVAEHRE